MSLRINSNTLQQYETVSEINHIDLERKIDLITKTIDLLVVVVIGVSALQTVLPASRLTIKARQKTKGNNIIIKNFIKSLLLALELESANAVLKMGIFALDTTNVDPHVSQNANNFIFFVAVLSVRIAINQTLRRFNW